MRAYRVYLAISAVFAFGFACAYTLNLVYQLRTVGLSPLELVLVGTALEVVCLTAQVPTGIIADLYSRRLSALEAWITDEVGEDGVDRHPDRLGHPGDGVLVRRDGRRGG